VAWAAWTVASFFGLGLRLSGAVVMGTSMLYALMCGLSPSVVRATVMTAALVAGILFQRPLDLLQSTALAALAILLARPYDLFDAGFQLSFAAVAGIVCLRGDIAAALRPKPTVLERAAAAEYLSRFHRLRLWLRPREVNAVAVSISASLGVMPLLAYYFNLFSPVALLANLIAVPLYSFATILAIIHVGVAAASDWLAAAPALLVRGTMALITAVIEGSARLPMAWVYCATPKLGWVAGYYALALLFVARGRLRLRGKPTAAAWIAGVILYLIATGSTPRPKGLEMTVLDVEHGLAAVLRYPDGSTVLYDCGTYGRRDVGRWVVAPALWSWGVRRIDLLVVSHADVDHVNGIPPLLERFPIGRVLHSPVLGQASAGAELLRMLDDRGIPHQAAWAGERFELGRGNLLEVLNPTNWTLLHHPGDQNENSLVLRATHDGRRILVGGDLQRVGAAVLPHLPVDVRADVLVVPHHGCEMKYGDGFARAIRPAYAICSNRADHLAPSTLANYQSVGAEILATCWDGAITVRLAKDGVEVEAFRQRRISEQGRPGGEIGVSSPLP
jgi:competence protein ComEC